MTLCSSTHPSTHLETHFISHLESHRVSSSGSSHCIFNIGANSSTYHKAHCITHKDKMRSRADVSQLNPRVGKSPLRYVVSSAQF